MNDKRWIITVHVTADERLTRSQVAGQVEGKLSPGAKVTAIREAQRVAA